VLAGSLSAQVKPLRCLLLPAAACVAACAGWRTLAMSCTGWCLHGPAATPMTGSWLQHCGTRVLGWLGCLHSRWSAHSVWPRESCKHPCWGHLGGNKSQVLRFRNRRACLSRCSFVRKLHKSRNKREGMRVGNRHVAHGWGPRYPGRYLLGAAGRSE
jgi:hypothetical protein